MKICDQAIDSTCFYCPYTCFMGSKYDQNIEFYMTANCEWKATVYSFDLIGAIVSSKKY
jgi:hypothetical protein